MPVLGFIFSDRLLYITDEPAVSDHPKCQVEMVAKGRWSLKRA